MRRCGGRRYDIGTFFCFGEQHNPVEYAFVDANGDRIKVHVTRDKRVLVILSPKNEICVLVDVKDTEPVAISRG